MKNIARLLLTAILAMPLLTTGCAHHVYVWGPGESPYYSRWEVETHRDHVEWEQRNATDQHAYWDWRKHHQS
jgi:hypothetical protein